MYTLASELFHTRGALCEMSSWCTLRGPSWFASHVSMCWLLLVICRGLFATSSFVEGRPLVPSFANIIGVLPLLQASKFYHVRLMKTSPKLLFIIVIVIVIFSILFSSRCSCLFFVESLLYTQQNIYQNITLLKILWNYLSNEWSFALNGVQTRELWPFCFSTACTTFDVFAITSCGKLRLTSFLIRWNRNFVELLNIQKYTAIFFWGRAEYWWE